MIKRLSTAAVGVWLVLHATSALAGPYFGYDGRSYGELKNAPDYGRPMKARAMTAPPKVVKGGGSRRGLTPAALALLARIEGKFGPVQVVSGYRAGARIAGSGRVSRHASGNAIDFSAGGRKGAIVKWLIANHKSGGTMTYSDMSHIHVDIGQHFVSLGANSHKGGGYRSRRSHRYSNDSGTSRRYRRRGERRYGYRDEYRGGSRRGYRRGNGGGQRQRRSNRFASGYATIYR
jgi:Peptidase M15